MDKDRRHAAAVQLNQEIAKHARRKELTLAMQLYDKAVITDVANTRTFAAVINCNVRCGNLPQACSIFEKLKTYKKGMKVDTIICTTLLKGICEQGDIPRAINLFAEMGKLGVVPNIRTMNTFFRGCVQVGAIDEADQMMGRMQREWQISPDVSSWEYLVVLLCQGLRLEKLLPIMGRLKGDTKIPRESMSAMQAKLACAASLLGDLKTSRKALVAAKEEFGKIGQIIPQNFSEKHLIDSGSGEDDDYEVQGSYKNFIERSASGGKRAWKAESDATRDDSLVHFLEHKRTELQQDIFNTEAFVTKLAGGGSGKIPVALPYFRHLISFPPQPTGEFSAPVGDTEKTFAPPSKINTALENSSILRQKLIDCLLSASRIKFGLDACLLRQTPSQPPPSSNIPGSTAAESGKKTKSKKRKFSDTGAGNPFPQTLPGKKNDALLAPPPPPPPQTNLRDSIQQFREYLESCFDASNHIDFSRVFSTRNGDATSPAHSPLKLEICSGAGEWAVAQARADLESNWVTLELRHDRVNQTFSRMVCAEATNVCVMGGDAMQVIPSYIAANTFNNVFINHPEPPQQTARRETTEGKHLLTPDFFAQVARILVTGGMLVVTTDNLWYAKFLLRQFATDPTLPGMRPLVSAKLEQSTPGKWTVFETDMGVTLYEGRPGRECGVFAEEASSYFDRLWKRAHAAERYFLVFTKNSRANLSIFRISSSSTPSLGPSKSLKKIKNQGIVVAPMGKKTVF